MEAATRLTETDSLAINLILICHKEKAKDVRYRICILLFWFHESRNILGKILKLFQHRQINKTMCLHLSIIFRTSILLLLPIVSLFLISIIEDTYKLYEAKKKKKKKKLISQAYCIMVTDKTQPELI